MTRTLVDSLRALKTTIANAMRKPTTVQFPKEIRPRAERLRTSFALLHDEHGDELCIGCLFCEKICPSQVIKVVQAKKRESPVTGKSRGYADDFTLDMSACIFCELCVQVCPTDAIVMTKEQDPPSFAREDLVLTMPKLYANEKSKHRAWSDGTKLMGMQDGPKPAKAAPHAKAHGSGGEADAQAKSKEPASTGSKPADSQATAAGSIEKKPTESKPAEPPASGQGGAA